MKRKEYYQAVDRLARFKYIKNRIDPSGLYPSGLLDISVSEIENLYNEAANEIASNLRNIVGSKSFVTAAELKATIENEYQEKLEQMGTPDGKLRRLDLYRRIEEKYLDNRSLDVGPSGVQPSGQLFDEVIPSGIDPYGINTYFV